MKMKFIAAIFLIGGLGMVIWGTFTLIDAKSSTGWPTVEGYVVSSSVHRYMSRSAVRYSPKVMYEYFVDDARYTSKYIIFGAYEFSHRSSAQNIANRYPLGKKVLVYYRPQRPETAVLIPGATHRAYLGLGMGIFLLAAGGYTFYQTRISQESEA